MEQEIQPPLPEPAPAVHVRNEQAWPDAPVPGPDEEYHGLRWIFIGSQGLRSGWSVAIFVLLTVLLLMTFGTAAVVIFKRVLHEKMSVISPLSAIAGELISFLSILVGGSVVGAIEHRRVLDYNLAGPRRTLHFLAGMVAGFAALSALVGAMAWGGWLRFGPAALSGPGILTYAALWSVAFLLTGLFEEGSFRCFLQFTFTRGINFWWALGIVGVVCVDLLLRNKGNDAWGVYAAALLGLVPCWLLHQAKAKGAGFWQAAWVTSTLFGFIHTGNNGENWIGIFAAAAIGFVFCVSVRLTGSAWWAIGCHSAWDWAETYFYGTPDSGFVSQGHYLTTTPVGNVLWSGGADGPEGSVLVLGAIVLLLVALLVIYGRREPTTPAMLAKEHAAS